MVVVVAQVVRRTVAGRQDDAERLLGERNAQRETVELTLPPSVLALEVGDAIEVGGESFEVTEIRGQVKDGTVEHLQVGMKVGFRLEDD